MAIVSLECLKMGFLLLKSEWDQWFNFCSESHGAGGWMWRSPSQINISVLLSTVCLVSFICSFPPPRNYSYLIWQGIHSLPNTLSQDICCVKWILSLMKRINTVELSSLSLRATSSTSSQLILAFSLHPQWYLLCILYLSMFPAFKDTRIKKGFPSFTVK